MVTFITIVHIILALLLVFITFIQDSKSESLGGAFGGGSSHSIFGAAGATTFIQKMTWWLAGFFVVTSISLAHYSSQGSRSVLDSVVLPATPSSETPPTVPADPASSDSSEAPASSSPSSESQSGSPSGALDKASPNSSSQSSQGVGSQNDGSTTQSE
jgi:preprotein translocase subunit SecG